jgi:putative nucleotidyltransferase with HDIG domain
VPEALAKSARPWALRSLPSFPAVASRIIALVSSDEVSVKEVGRIIKLDATFTAEVLRVANSALFGVPREVRTVAAATALLGLERIKAIATLVAVQSMVKSVLRMEVFRRFWEHSLVTAILAEETARTVGGGSPEGAYTAGLLHNLGALGLMAAYPDEYARMLEVSRENQFDLLRTELDLFEIDHCAAGAYLAREWNFPDEIVTAIATHHDEPTAGDKSVCGVVQVSWRLADVLGYGAFPMEKPWAYDELVALAPGLSHSWLGAGAEEATAAIASWLRDFHL